MLVLPIIHELCYANLLKRYQHVNYAMVFHKFSSSLCVLLYRNIARRFAEVKYYKVYEYGITLFSIEFELFLTPRVLNLLVSVHSKGPHSAGKPDYPTDVGST